LPAAGPASIRIYDVAGRLVRELAGGPFEAGPQLVIWDGRGANGREMGSGVYYIRLETPHGDDATSVTLLK
jgi:flagellar hook assembly protein FlgD